MRHFQPKRKLSCYLDYRKTHQDIDVYLSMYSKLGEVLFYLMHNNIAIRDYHE